MMNQSAVSAIEDAVRAAFEAASPLAIEEIIHEPMISFRVKELVAA